MDAVTRLFIILLQPSDSCPKLIQNFVPVGAGAEITDFFDSKLLFSTLKTAVNDLFYIV
jgi:hypothetical protein